MIKFENYEVIGWEHAVRGMRNPMNSWDNSDSKFKGIVETDILDDGKIKKQQVYFDALGIGKNDYELMMKLRNAGTDHRKFMRMIAVYVDITAPLYWWKEFDTYKVGTVANSCSTMHKIHEKEFTLDDFSCEHLGVTIPAELNDGEIFQDIWIASLKRTIFDLNVARDFYINERYDNIKKKYWWQMIQLLPSSYNQKRTVMLNYEVLANIYKSRKNHKLDEWIELCEWIESLPYFELIVGNDA